MRKTAIAIALILSVSLSVLGAGLTARPARAANYFDQSVYEGVGAVTAAVTSLPAFMQDGEARAAVREKMQDAYRAMTEGGFDMGAIAAEGGNYGVRKWNDMGVQEFRGGAHTADLWDRVHGYIIAGSAATNIPAGCLVNEILVKWSDNMNAWGFPIGNRFFIDGQSDVQYQNFINGYVKLQNNIASFYQDSFMNGDGSTGSVPVAVQAVGQLNGSMPQWAVGKTASITNAFKAAAEKVKTTDAVQAGGYDLGEANDYANLWRPEDLVISQRFVGGDNTGNPYGWGKQGRLMVNDADSVAFPLLGDNLTRWAQLNGLRQVGYPLSYPYAMGGESYQIFSKSYFQTDRLGYIEHVKLYAGAVSEVDKYKLSDTVSFGSASSNFMAAYKNFNNTGANFGIPDNFVQYADGRFTQAFTAPDGAKNYLAQRGERGSCFTVTGNAAVFFGEPGKTGAPVGTEFETGGSRYQNFEKGYVNITANAFTANKQMLIGAGVEAASGETELHAKTGVLEGGAGLFDAQALKTEFVAAVKALNADGNYVYEPSGALRVIDGSTAVQEFKNTSSSAKGKLALIKASRSAGVYAVKDQIYTQYLYEGGFDGGVGAPTGEQFCLGVRLYQNFLSGYISVDSINAAAYENGQNVSREGVYTDIVTKREINPVPSAVGQFGDITRIPAPMRGKQDYVRAAFQAEYARLMQLGFFPGNPDTELVHQWAPAASFLWVNQTFAFGDSTANVFNNTAAMKIFLIDGSEYAYSVYGEMLTAWVNVGGFDKLGYPVGNQFFYGDDLYQNFNGGYIKCANGTSSAASLITNEAFEIPDAQAGETNAPRVWLWVGIGGGVLALAAAAGSAAWIILRKRGKGGKA
ncbi:MAG: hypothetical protein LBL66_06865 [Clostridiales bacterium]|jgi:uncharacterized protein with LGFP repeats|nr:hypothetical protein [Clostridiales bacterium]